MFYNLVPSYFAVLVQFCPYKIANLFAKKHDPLVLENILPIDGQVASNTNVCCA